MVDISSQNNKINVTVSSSGNTANTNVTPDYAQYYSEKSKEWAISNKIVDNTDYSSKYYANESKTQADISTAKATEVIESGNTAVSNIESARDNAIIDITNQESLSVDNVNTAGVTQISSINTAGITQVANVNSAGTTQINLAKEQVTLATNQANIATEQATIATSKTTEVVASGNEALSNIDTTKDNAITTITTQETTSKNNIITTGNEQVARIEATGNNYDNLTHKNITNCLLEVPQRIKYELADGTLTVKAGSIVIVPYGTEDLTAQYTVGATFINDNFKVYYTQFEDGKFFVWAELVNDLSSNYKSSTSEAGNRMVYLIFNLGTSSWYLQSEKIEYCFSGTQGTTTTGHYSLYYNANTNLCARYNSNAQVLANHSPASLPCLVVYHNTSTGTMETVPQVFNGIGYIGSTVWVDKGVKGLIPNGRNTDGSLNNTETITTGVKTRTLNITGSGEYYVAFNPNITLTSVKTYSYDEEKNKNLSDGTDWNACVLGRMQVADNKITSLNPKLPFRVADAQDIDGIWTYKYLKVASATAIKKYTYDLSDYLPNDGNMYEVTCRVFAARNDTSGTNSNITISSNFYNNASSAPLYVTLDGTNFQQGYGSLNIIIPADRKLVENITGYQLYSCDVALYGFRKVR